jgi:hypothetical protein
MIRVLASCLLTMLACNVQAELDEQWRFRVSLDDRVIGHHHFVLREEDGQSWLTSEAEFEVKLLFVTLYRYRHQAREIWRDGCLVSVESETDANGSLLEVRGLAEEGAFRVESTQGPDVLPPCVMTFAYWNPEFLEQAALLNPQDGAYLEVEVNGPVMVALEMDGRSVEARRFHLDTEDLDITVWYSPQGDWLALESPAKGGRKLRYERIWDEEPVS